MLSKKFRKYITPAQRRKFLRLFKQKFSNQEYLLFLKKFRGSMLSKGRSSFSYKLFDKIRMFFKKVLKYHAKETKQYIDFDSVLRVAISNLIPILGTSNVRRGRRVQTVPVLLKLRKRIVLINKWLISNQKNKSNVRGIKINEVSRLIALAFDSKGSAYEQKIESLKRAYAAKHILLKMGKKRVNKRAFRRLQRRVLLDLEKKHDILNAKNAPKVLVNPYAKPTVKPKKEVKPVKPEILVDSIGTLFSLIIFFKYKRKYKKVKRIAADLRSLLLSNWGRHKLTLERRWKLLWNWILFESKKKTIKINTRKLDFLKPKYKLVCEDIVKRTGS